MTHHPLVQNNMMNLLFWTREAKIRSVQSDEWELG